MLRVVTNLLLCLGAGLLWWAGNIQYGNLKALEYMGWLSAYPWYVAWVAAILPSISQLFITEQWDARNKKDERGKEPEPIDPLSMVFAGFVAIVIDLGGPVLGFFVVTGLYPDMWTLGGAIVLAAFVSILCQHVAWVRCKATVTAIFALLNNTPSKSPAKKQKPVQEQPPIRLADKVPHLQMQHHLNGREKENANPAKDE